MTPRPIRRWKSFWLGLFVLSFLAWSWGASLSHMTGVGFHTPVGNAGIIQYAGEVCIYRGNAKRGWHWAIIHVPAPKDSPGGRKIWEKLASTGFMVPHGLIMALYSSGLAAFILWRRHRNRQLARRRRVR